MWKKVAITLAALILLLVTSFAIWFHTTMNKYADRRTEIQDCLNKRAPNQICEMTHDGGVILRDKAKGFSPLVLPHRHFTGPR